MRISEARLESRKRIVNAKLSVLEALEAHEGLTTVEYLKVLTELMDMALNDEVIRVAQ